MPPPSRSYADLRRFSAAFNQAVKKRVEDSERSFEQLSREFYLQRFLARVFAEFDHPWVLKGGTNLLTRFPERARHSQDIDLMYRDAPAGDLDAAVGELRHLAGAHPELDPFTFTIGRVEAMTGGAAGLRLSVAANFGAAQVHRFSIDLVADLPVAAQLDRYRPEPVFEFAAVSDLPTFTLYPLPDQIADKVCAMYERYGTSRAASSRYRDLVDLLVIIGNQTLDAAVLIAALDKESTRRTLTLPQQLHQPAPAWRGGYLNEARRSMLPTDLRALDAALAAAAACFDPILSRTITEGTWTPGQARWIT